MENTKFTVLVMAAGVIAGSLTAMTVPTEMKTRSHWSGLEDPAPAVATAAYRLVESGPVDLSPDFHPLAALDDPIASDEPRTDDGHARISAYEPRLHARHGQDHLSDLATSGEVHETFVPPMSAPAATLLVETAPPASRGDRSAIVRVVREPQKLMENSAAAASVGPGKARGESLIDR